MTLVLTFIALFACAFYLDWAAMSLNDLRLGGQRRVMPAAVRVLWGAVILIPALVLLACVVIYPFIMVEWPESIRGVKPAEIVAVILVGVVATLGYVFVQRDAIFTRRASRSRGTSRGIPLKGFWLLAAILTYWKLVGDPASISTPPPYTWWEALKTLYEEGLLMPAFWETLTTFLIGLVAATIFGVVIGNAIGASSRLDRALGPSLEFLRNSPPAPYVPILLLFFAPGRMISVAIIIVGGMWPVLLNTATARRSIPVLRLDVARSFNLKRWAQQQKIVLPSLTPGIAVGLRIAGPVCLIITLLVDLLTTAGGLGTLMIESQRLYEAADAFSVLMVIGVIGYLSSVLVVRLEAFLMRRWPDSAF